MNTLTEQQSLRFEVSDNDIVTLWLDGDGRPVVVLDRHLIQRLNSTLDEIEVLKGIKGLMLKSDCERVFVAGADLAEIDTLDDQGLHGYLAFGTTVFSRIAKLPYPTVALINGAALGGGLEIAMAADIRIGARDSGRVGLPEINLGVLPGTGGTQRLVRMVGKARAIELMTTGRLISFEEAHDLDIINEIFENENFDEQVMNYAKQFTLPNKAVKAVGNIKRSFSRKKPAEESK